MLPDAGLAVNVRSVFKSIAQCSALQNLNLSHCNFKKFPVVLLECINLKYLDIHGTPLVKVGCSVMVGVLQGQGCTVYLGKEARRQLLDDTELLPGESSTGEITGRPSRVLDFTGLELAGGGLVEEVMGVLATVNSFKMGLEKDHYLQPKHNANQFMNLNVHEEGGGSKAAALFQLLTLKPGDCKFDGVNSAPSPGFVNWSKLSELNWSSANYNFEHLPTEIRHLGKLVELNLSDHSKLKDLPKSMGECTQLTRLKLARCSGLAKFPAVIADLRAIRYLDVSGTAIEGKLSAGWYGADLLCWTELPESIEKLTWLGELDCKGCKSLKSTLH